ncbi:nuclear transport factor 2 family protein [Granulicella sp. S190]|uniref:nuclear transport factor 2 family protein n=1 Tax=Granulicella sp. S190 TaxID=1747226 RepID=UPI00131CF975|nr:nuclear transport factor 2 family protein [Granulicella sp. S190]
MRLSLLVLVLMLACASPAQNPVATPPAPIDIVKLEQNLWTTMAEGDFATVRSLFTPDFIQIDDHIQALDTLLITLKHCKLESYELRDLQVRLLTPDSAIAVYHVVNTFNCGTAENPSLRNGDNNSVTVWVRHHGTEKWLAQAHTDTPAKP